MCVCDCLCVLCIGGLVGLQRCYEQCKGPSLPSTCGEQGKPGLQLLIDRAANPNMNPDIDCHSYQ